MKTSIRLGAITRYHFIRESEIPFVFEWKNGGKSGFANHDGKRYKVLTHVLCGEFYNNQPDTWWKAGHNIELQEVLS